MVTSGGSAAALSVGLSLDREWCSAFAVSTIDRKRSMNAVLLSAKQLWQRSDSAGTRESELRVPGQQRLEVLGARGGGQLSEQVGQVGVRFDAVGLGGLDQRVEIRARRGAALCVAEEPVAPADHEGADRVLDPIGVERDMDRCERSLQERLSSPIGRAHRCGIRVG